MATEYLNDKRKLVGIRYMLLCIAGVNALISFILSMLSSFFSTFIPVCVQALIIGVLAYILPIMVYAKTNRITAERAAEKFYLQKCRVSELFLTFVMGCGFQFVMVLINLPVNILIGSPESYVPTSGAEFLAAVVVFAVMPAVFEEFLFRGIVAGSMTEFNSRAALIFSAVMFALMHADIYCFIGYVIMGVLLVSVVRRTGSVYSAMVFHFANNTTALLLGFFSRELTYMPVFTVSLFAVGTVVFAAAYVLFSSVTKKPKNIARMKTGSLLGQSFVSLPILLCVVIIVAASLVISLM